MTTNLAGSLGTFGLDEVLSMLAMGGRSAHMEVSSPNGDGEIHVVDGHVSAASADRGRATLLRQVVGSAEVTAADLAGALEAADPVRALVDSGTVERGFAHSVAVEQIVDALGEMLTWTDGEFAVHVGAEHPGDIGIRLPMDEAVDRGRGRADEWTRVRAALPAEHEVLALAAAVADGVSLGRDDWAVLVRVDGRRTLGEVVAAAGCAPLVASDRIVDLMGRGLVRVRTEAADHPDEVAQLLDSAERSGADGHVVTWDAGRGLDVPLASPVADEAPDDGVTDVEPEPVPVVPVMDEVVAAEPGPVEPEPADVEDLEPVEPGEPVEPVVAAAVEEGYATLAPLAPAEEAPAEFSFPVEVEAVAWEPERQPEAWDLGVDEPVAGGEGPVAGAVEWSPWAQALGLGAAAPEGELVGDPLAGPGIADLIAGAQGFGDTEAVPVPLAPAFEHGEAAPSEVAVGAATLEAGVPEPRVSAEAETVPVEDGSHVPGAVPEIAEPVADAAPDPLAGGLLAQLMSGVRGF